ncbi:MAG: excinuclease ABC subunit UvrC [Ruminococcaceae bacterium]|nr:excinuclease ABC subunit UvrC [Oscillospiraceae bacterium]
MRDFDYKIKSLPEKSGVYIMKNESGEVIYVGKAKVLKNRVSQYFNNSKHTPKVEAMVSNVHDFEYIITDSEMEALVLECNLIKEYMPKYNILLKDDKTYPFIKITLNEMYPRISVVRKVIKDGARYFGPYQSSYALKELMDFFREIYGIRSCNKVFPRDIKKGRSCLYRHIGKCMGVCEGDIDEKEYRERIMKVCEFLSGNTDEVRGELYHQMKTASERFEFEKAATIRDRLNSIDVILKDQKATSTTDSNSDLIGMYTLNNSTCIQIFFVRGGKIIGRESYFFENTSVMDEAQIMSDFINQYYQESSFVPDNLYLQHEIEDGDIFEDFLTKKRGRRVYIKTPKKGENLKIINMIRLNARKELENRELKILKDIKFKNHALSGLKKVLGLKTYPHIIEAYDMSGYQGEAMVGEMVTFIDAKPSNKHYRSFNIKTVTCQDDYGSMREVIKRRLSHIGDKGFGEAPDVIFADGGLGQINAVIDAMNEMNIHIPVYGIVKDDKHNTRTVMDSDGNLLDFSDEEEAFMLVIRIQDEMHRRAINHYRNIKEKEMLHSSLLDIKGVGEKKRRLLLDYFKSVSKIKNATLDQLMNVDGIDKKTAQEIVKYFESTK